MKNIFDFSYSIVAYFLLAFLIVCSLPCDSFAVIPAEDGESADNGEESVTGDVDVNVIDALDANKNYEIYVNIPSFTLSLISDGVVEKKYKIRVGKPKTPTICGVGSITRKFVTSYFRYSSGPQKGEVIRYSNIRNTYNGKIVKRIKIPYEKIKGLELEINGEITGQIIHATTNPETMGHACSSGCVGMSIEDTLDLYKRVEAGTKVLIEYNLVEYNDGVFYFYEDVYKRKPDYFEIVREALNSNGISYTDEFVKEIVASAKKNKKVNIADVYERMRASLAVDDAAF